MMIHRTERFIGDMSSRLSAARGQDGRHNSDDEKTTIFHDIIRCFEFDDAKVQQIIHVRKK